MQVGCFLDSIIGKKNTIAGGEAGRKAVVIGMAAEKSIREKRSKSTLKVYPINPGSTKLWGYYAPGKLNSDMFLNLRAQLWWKIRKRFEKTYQKVNKKHDHPDDECISIPNDHELILELSQPKVFQNEAGKLQIESKEKQLGLV